MRAAIVNCILKRTAFLFLDEPTTHLDIESIEMLEQILGGYAGGFLSISHDRAFVFNVTDKLYAIEDGYLKLVEARINTRISFQRVSEADRVRTMAELQCTARAA